VTRLVVAGPVGDRPPGVVLNLPELLLPMRWWRKVLLRQAVRIEMTPMERLTVELALALGRADPQEFLEVSGLPAALLPVAARRLVTAGALEADDDGYQVVPSVAVTIATNQTLSVERYVPYDILVLPRTGDILALETRSSVVRTLERLRPRSVGSAPVPAQWCGRSLGDILNARFASGPIPGVSEGIRGIADPTIEYGLMDDDGLCPVYRCAGTLRIEDDQHVPSVVVNGGPEVSLDLRGAEGLTERWRMLPNALDDEALLGALWADLTADRSLPIPALERRGAGGFRVSLTGTVADRLGQEGRNLALPLTVEIHDEDLVAEVRIEMTPGDERAHQLIVLDRELNAAAQPGATATPRLHTDDARERAWDLGFYPLVYALREAVDFDY
jgi:hypothetical protein